MKYMHMSIVSAFATSTADFEIDTSLPVEEVIDCHIRPILGQLMENHSMTEREWLAEHPEHQT